MKRHLYHTIGMGVIFISLGLAACQGTTTVDAVGELFLTPLSSLRVGCSPTDL